MNKVFRYFRGYSKIRVEGKNVKRFFKSCVNRNIILEDLVLSEGLIYASVINSELEEIKKLTSKTNVELRILSTKGFPEVIKTLLNHPIKVSLSLLIVLIYMFLNTRILKIVIDGNSEISDEIILNELQNSNIQFFSSIKSLDCGKIEHLILKNHENIKWCSVFTNGNVLNILIDEENIIETEPSNYQYCISNVYGTVKKIYIRSGYSKLKPGDTVMPGDILISGVIPVTNSYEEIIGERIVIPDGDIILEFTCCEQIVQPLAVNLKEYTGEEKKSLDFYWNNNKLFSYLPSISYESCDIITENKGISVFGIDLPVNLIIYQFNETENTLKNYTQEEAAEILESKYELILQSYINSGYELINSDYSITPFTDCLSLNYNITVSGPAFSYE